MAELRELKGKILVDHFPLTEVDLFKIKNGLSDAEYEHILLRRSIGQNPTGEIKFPNGTTKIIEK